MTGPSGRPTALAAVQITTARARCPGSGNKVGSMANPSGSKAAPASPRTACAAISSPDDPDRAHQPEAAANKTSEPASSRAERVSGPQPISVPRGTISSAGGLSLGFGRVSGPHLVCVI